MRLPLERIRSESLLQIFTLTTTDLRFFFKQVDGPVDGGGEENASVT